MHRRVRQNELRFDSSGRNKVRQKFRVRKASPARGLNSNGPNFPFLTNALVSFGISSAFEYQGTRRSRTPLRADDDSLEWDTVVIDAKKLLLGPLIMRFGLDRWPRVHILSTGYK